VFALWKICWSLKGPLVKDKRGVESSGGGDLASESVEGASLSLESIDDVHGSDGLPLGVLCVIDCVKYQVLEEDPEDTSDFAIDEFRDSLDSSTTSETTDGGFRDPIDVVTKRHPST